MNTKCWGGARGGRGRFHMEGIVKYGGGLICILYERGADFEGDKHWRWECEIGGEYRKVGLVRSFSSWDLKVGKRVVLRLWMKLAWWNPSKSEVTNWGESRSIQEYSTDLPILHYGCHPSKLESLIRPSDLKCFSWNCNFWEILIHFVLVFQHSVNKFNHKSLCSVNLHSWWGPGLGGLSCWKADFFPSLMNTLETLTKCNYKKVPTFQHLPKWISGLVSEEMAFIMLQPWLFPLSIYPAQTQWTAQCHR